MEEKNEKEIAFDILNHAEAIMMERNKTYDHPDDLHSEIMCMLYPEGLVSNIAKMKRFKYIMLIVEKLIRYKFNIDKGGHEDSLIDIANYAFKLAAYDRKMKEE
jgi:hypothetical protein